MATNLARAHGALPASPSFINLGTSIAVVVVVVTSVATSLIGLSDTRKVAAMLGGVAYILASTLGLSVAERRQPSWFPLAMVTVQGLLGCLVGWATRFGAGLVLMPFFSTLVLYASTRWACLVAIPINVVFALAEVHEGWPVREVLQGHASFLAAAAFVIVFSRLVVRETHARADVERLAAEVARANDQLREYSMKVEELTIAKERNRVAREIHDTLGHCLTVASVQIEAARFAKPAPAAVKPLGAKK